MAIKKPLISLKQAFVILLLLYALMEFYPVLMKQNELLRSFAALLALAWVLIFPHKPILTSENMLPLSFLGIWLLYSLFSFAWAIDSHSVLEHCLHITRNLIVFMLFEGLFRDHRIRDKAYYLYLAVLVAYMATAVWEISTLQHLNSSRLYGQLSIAPTGPFFGENILAAMLLMLLPLLVFLPKLHQQWWVKLLSGVLITLVMGIMIIQGARIAIISGLAMLGFGITFYSAWRTRLSVAIVLLILLAGVWIMAPQPLRMVWKMLSTELSSIGSEGESAHMSSVQIRKQLIVETLDMAADNHFLGVGAGNFERHMRGTRMFRTAGITNAHNFLMELLGNNGLGIMLFFLFMYCWWLYRLYYAYLHGEPQRRVQYLMFFFVLLMFLPASTLPSSIRWNYLIWIIFAHINSLAMSRKEKEHEAI